eukprot:3522548-Rhodomonas_salina.3
MCIRDSRQTPRLFARVVAGARPFARQPSHALHVPLPAYAPPTPSPVPAYAVLYRPTSCLRTVCPVCLPPPTPPMR